MSLPEFPVDEQTLCLLESAMNPGPESGRSDVTAFLLFMSSMGGSDVDAVDSTEGDGFVEVVVYREAAYHEHDVIRALVAEVRRLRTESA